MNYDENMTCPVCFAKLFTDEVAVCPECGAPHHKKCFLKLNHCAYADKHGTPEQWQPPKIEPPKPVEQIGEKCQNCGYVSEKGSCFCQKCGKSLQPSNQYVNQNEFNTSGIGGENPFFVTNNIDKDELIDGERTENIAKFVGYNALRYLRIFKRQAGTKKKISWNWLGFLLPEFWLASRKCYPQAILLGFYNVLTTVLFNISGINNYMSAYMETGVVPNIAPNTFFLLSALSIVSLVISVFFGIFGDYIYKKKVFSSIKQMKDDNETTDIDFIKQGGVSLTAPFILYIAVYMLSAILLSFF